MQLKHFKSQEDIKNYYDANIRHLDKFRYGSEDSLDKDIIINIDNLDLNMTQFYREIGFYMSQEVGIEVNFCLIRDGFVVECLKGNPNSVNNSLYFTFNLHPENSGLVCPIVSTKEVALIKYVEAIRTCLALMSRSSIRDLVKPTLSSRNQDLRDNTLLNIDLMSIETDIFNIEKLKAMAFTLAQSWLLLNDFENVYTKSILIKNVPQLSNLIARQGDLSENLKSLNTFKNEVIRLFKEKYTVSKQDLRDCNNHINIFVNKKSLDETKICVLKERLL